ncbi:formate--tetrahydrofolate ligase [Anaerococcus porci]|uniref:formate--tetrahydrofolate ligase n=1 Tax=Anaerococcus porci TaxID=2652269 RepID=UPI002A755520|nr:formate--tetrahydrofolate ligase [Anaerococcus porci]MDY3007345.1 formate--tetrahydrofolate ligase [Anaerococcus porci]
MKKDIEIAREAQIKDIDEIAHFLNIEKYEKYGNYKAKIDLSYSENQNKDSKLVLVTAISPTPYGEGKTTMNIALSMGLNKLGKKAISALREPSLGPSFGIKGGACGAGYSQVIPMEDINLHFTGDFHAITSAVNLVASMIDNHIYQGNEKNIDLSNILWKRCVDLNDRALREVVVGLGKKTNGIARQDGYDITVATEMMAVFCLSNNLNDFREKVSRMIVAYDYDNNPVTVDDIKATGPVVVLMKDALKPNLVQTLENTPAIIHGGPFANIAHGCNSIIATKTALALSEYTVTEAGFGADLGAEKFYDIKCRKASIKPNITVIVASVRALKYHGGVSLEDINCENLEGLKSGFKNLKVHLENLKKFSNNVVVAINKFDQDTKAELSLLKELVNNLGIEAFECDVYHKGSEGCLDICKYIIEKSNKDNDFKLLYDESLSIKEKIDVICKEIYRANGVKYTKKALDEIERIENLNSDKLPVCIAKTQYSFSDDPKNLNPESEYEITINDIRLNQGAGFIVAITQNIMTMPGLGKKPAAYEIDIDGNGNIVGLF